MWRSLNKYWEYYGGIKAVLVSGYFWVSFFITVISYKFWLEPTWHDKFLGIFPSLLGFSLAGYAVWLTLGDPTLKKILSKKKQNGDPSTFLVINASFIHFIIMQLFAFIGLFFLETNSLLSIIDQLSPGLNNCMNAAINYIGKVFNCFIFFLCIYSIFSMLAAVFGLFAIAQAMDKLQGDDL